MNASDILRAARELITDREAWTRDSYACNSRGRPCGVFDRHAVSFCSAGVIYKVGGDIVVDGPFSYLKLAMQQVSGRPITIPRFNDTHGHDSVLAAFDKAIELAEADGKRSVGFAP